jgi:hypothetical protein
MMAFHGEGEMLPVSAACGEDFTGYHASGQVPVGRKIDVGPGLHCTQPVTDQVGRRDNSWAANCPTTCRRPPQSTGIYSRQTHASGQLEAHQVAQRLSPPLYLPPSTHPRSMQAHSQTHSLLSESAEQSFIVTMNSAAARPHYRCHGRGYRGSR